MADFEDANTPNWDNNIQGHINLRDAIRRRIDYVVAGGQGVPAERQDRRRCSCGRAAGICPRSTSRSTARRSPAASSTSRCTSSTTRRSSSRAAADRISTCRSSRAISRRGCGTTSSSMAQDELGVPRGTIKATVLIETILAAFEMDEILYELARAFGGAQLRPLGLHLLVHQEVPQQPRLLPRRPRAGDDDDALHEELRGAAHQDLPPPQHPRDGRDGGADPGQERRERQRRGVREGQGRQGARGDDTATTAPGSRIRGWCRVAKEAFDRLMPAPNQIATKKREDVQRERRRPAALRARSSRSPRRACASTSTSRSSTSARGSRARARCRSST